MGVVPIHRLHRHLPGHLAMNAALLLRKARPVVQIDKEDGARVSDFANAVRRVGGVDRVSTWSYSEGTLVWIERSDLPKDVRESLRNLVALSNKAGAVPYRLVLSDVNTCLRLQCPARALASENKFRVVLEAITADDTVWSFKQQMCANVSHVASIMRELLRYEEIANEMGFSVVQLRVLRVPTRMYAAINGPSDRRRKGGGGRRASARSRG